MDKNKIKIIRFSASRRMTCAANGTHENYIRRFCRNSGKKEINSKN